MTVIDDIQRALELVKQLPVAPLRIRFRSKEDVIRILGEPQPSVWDVSPALNEFPWPAPSPLLVEIPIVFDEDLAPDEFKIDYPEQENTA